MPIWAPLLSVMVTVLLSAAWGRLGTPLRYAGFSIAGSLLELALSCRVNKVPSGGRFFAGEVGITHRKFKNGGTGNNVLTTGVGEGLLTHALFDLVDEGHVNIREGFS